MVKRPIYDIDFYETKMVNFAQTIDKKDIPKADKKERSFYAKHLPNEYSTSMMARVLAKKLEQEISTSTSSAHYLDAADDLLDPRFLQESQTMKMPDSVFSRAFRKLTDRFNYLCEQLKPLLDPPNSDKKLNLQAKKSPMVDAMKENLATLFNFIDKVFGHARTLPVKSYAYDTLHKAFDKYGTNSSFDCHRPTHPLAFASLDSLPKYNPSEEKLIKSKLGCPPSDLLVLTTADKDQQPLWAAFNFLAEQRLDVDNFTKSEWLDLKAQMLEIDINADLSSDSEQTEKVVKYLIMEAKFNPSPDGPSRFDLHVIDKYLARNIAFLDGDNRKNLEELIPLARTPEVLLT